MEAKLYGNASNKHRSEHYVVTASAQLFVTFWSYTIEMQPGASQIRKAAENHFSEPTRFSTPVFLVFQLCAAGFNEDFQRILQIDNVHLPLLEALHQPTAGKRGNKDTFPGSFLKTHFFFFFSILPIEKMCGNKVMEEWPVPISFPMISLKEKYFC